MSISDFNDAQKKAFMTLVRKMIFADDIVDFAESEAFIRLKERLGVSEFEEMDGDLQRLASNFDSVAEKESVLEELVRVSRVDHEYSEEERAFVTKISEMMNLDRDAVQAIESKIAG